MGLRVTNLLLILALVVSMTAVDAFAKKAADQAYPKAYPIDGLEAGYEYHGPKTEIKTATQGNVIGKSNLEFATAYYGRSIAQGPDGTLHAAWCTAGDPSNEALYSRSTDNGTTWSTPVEVHDGYYGYKPAIATHPTDPNIVIYAYVGYQNQGEIRSIRMSKSTDGGLTWGASVAVFGSAANCNNPDPVVDVNGNVYVGFDSYSDNFIRFNMSTDGGDTYLAEPEIVNLGQDAGTFSACTAVDKNGNVHLLYGGDGGENSWGDKNVYWNWRDNTIGLWMEIPPVQVSDEDTGTPYPSLVFDSQNVGHAVYDALGPAGQRIVEYRTLTDGTWSDPIEFPSDTDGGSTFMPDLGIDANDNLYMMYTDAHGGASLSDAVGDIFTGTNAGGDWQVINLTGTGRNVIHQHPNTIRTLADSMMHIIYTSGQVGDYTIEHMVGYPWPPEPTIGVTSLPDTYNPTGPFTVSAKTGDIDGHVVGASLTVQKNGETVQVIDMTMLEKDSYEATFTVDGVPGDVISYFGTATDNDGNTKESLPVEFSILAPTQPKADILLVYQDVQDDTFYTHILDKLGYVYELWDYEAHGGIDASVTTYGWSTILGFGWVFNAVPTRGYQGDPFAEFLQMGTDEAPKNLLVASMDYFFANNEVAEPEFAAGDFAYDFFQIGLGTNDPDPDKDSLLVGITGDPISGNWDEEPLWLDAGLTGIANWIDWTEATGNGLDIFFAANQGFGSGVSNDAGAFKTVMLPWMVTWLADSVAVDDSTWSYKVGEDAYTLIQNVLNFFGTSQGEASRVVSRDAVPREFSLSQNYPNPFNPETSISFTLPSEMKVELDIYNAVGQKIRTLVNSTVSSGSHVAIWDGRNDIGQKVSTGVYFYRIKAGDFSRTMKMVMVK